MDRAGCHPIERGAELGQCLLAGQNPLNRRPLGQARCKLGPVCGHSRSFLNGMLADGALLPLREAGGRRHTGFSCGLSRCERACAYHFNGMADESCLGASSAMPIKLLSTGAKRVPIR